MQTADLRVRGAVVMSKASSSSGRHKSGNRRGSSRYPLGIVNRSAAEGRSRNLNCWKVIFAVTVGRMGISTFTGKPDGSLKFMKSRSFEKCLNGAITSSTLSSISTERGKSELCKKKMQSTEVLLKTKRKTYHRDCCFKSFRRLLINHISS